MTTFNALKQVSTIKDPIERVKKYNRLLEEYQALVNEVSRSKRQAVAEAKESGMTTEAISEKLGVTPARVYQMSSQFAKNPELEYRKLPEVIMQRALPTDPRHRGSESLFLSEARQQGIDPGRNLMFVGIEQASDQVANCLNLETGDEVVARRKVLFGNDIPLRLSTSFFRGDLFGDKEEFFDKEFIKPSLQSAIKAHGYEFGHAVETLSIRPPSEFEVEVLKIEPGEWVAQVLRASYDKDDTPIHTLETICVSSRHVFTIGQVAERDEF